MPVKNTAQFLPDCLDSIICQSYPEWELLAVDDYSDDACFEILMEYAKKDPRIKVLKNTVSGIIGALKYGYSKSKGQYITRMDSDDLMPQEKLLELKKKLDGCGKGNVITGLVKYFFDKPVSEGYLQYEQWLNGLTQTESNFEDIYRECPIASPCWMVFRDDFEKAGGFNSINYPEDYDLCFRLFSSGLKIKTCKLVLHLWRDHVSRSSRTSPNYHMDRLVDMKLDYFQKLEVKDQDTIVLWSAGKKSKDIAKKLQGKHQKFRWVCTNDKKIGNQIYDVIIEDYRTISKMKNQKVIVPIAVKKYQVMIDDFFKTINLIRNRDYFFFS
jgi:glycosyltransferase involved in cell wall biosynthesis